MKLRQKLAMVLAAAMIITAVPVTTMAASENAFNKTISIVADAPITTGQGLSLDVKYTTSTVKDDVFYVTGQDFKFEKAAYDHMVDGKLVQGSVATEGFEVKYLSETELEVTVKSEAGLAGMSIPVAGTPGKGTPAITLDGTDSYATSGTYVLSEELTTDKTLMATVANEKNISIEGNGTIGDIVIEEKVAEQISGKEILVTLPNNSDLVFAANNDATNVVLKGSRGLSEIGVTPSDIKVSEDGKEIKVTMPESTATRTGSVAITGIKVAAENPREDVKTGEVKVTVEAESMETTKLVVAQIANYSVTMNVEEVKTLKAGQGTEVVNVVIEETTAGSLGNKPIYLTMDGAQFESVTSEKNIEFTDNKKEEIIIEPVQNPETPQKYEFQIEISAKAAQAGDVNLVAEGRGLEEEIELKIAEVTAPITIETESFNIEQGIKDQKGGKIVITETAAGELLREEIVIKAESEDLAIKSADVTVTGGDIKVKSEAKKGELIVTIERSSDEASEITIENIEMTAPKFMAEGGYDFLVGGEAISAANKVVVNEDGEEQSNKYTDSLTLESFVIVGDEHQASEAIFKMGEQKFTHNGEEITMDVAPYISAKNRVMIPLRFVSEAFGVAPQDIKFDQPTGTVTMFIDGQVIQLVNGSASVLVNGVNIPMEEAMTIKEDRAFLPMGELARILDIKVEWNNDTKTVTFNN